VALEGRSTSFGKNRPIDNDSGNELQAAKRNKDIFLINIINSKKNQKNSAKIYNSKLILRELDKEGLSRGFHHTKMNFEPHIPMNFGHTITTSVGFLRIEIQLTFKTTVAATK